MILLAYWAEGEVAKQAPDRYTSRFAVLRLVGGLPTVRAGGSSRRRVSRIEAEQKIQSEFENPPAEAPRLFPMDQPAFVRELKL